MCRCLSTRTCLPSIPLTHTNDGQILDSVGGGEGDVVWCIQALVEGGCYALAYVCTRGAFVCVRGHGWNLRAGVVVCGKRKCVGLCIKLKTKLDHNTGGREKKKHATHKPNNYACQNSYPHLLPHYLTNTYSYAFYAHTHAIYKPNHPLREMYAHPSLCTHLPITRMHA